MKTTITIHDVPEVIGYLQKAMADKTPALAELDSLIGDGDMGVTISLVFRSCVRYTKSMDTDISFAQLFTDLSAVIGENAPSTFGTFIATMCKSISASCGEIQEIDAVFYGNMLNWAAKGVMTRGGAKLGDKTLLDALIPAATAAKLAASDGNSLADTAKIAAQSALAGAENTVNLKATTGRAGYMGDRTIGNKDPGAEAIAQILMAFAEYMTTRVGN